MAVFRVPNSLRTVIDGEWTLPRARGGDPFVEGPTERLHDPSPRRSGPDRVAGLAVLLALVAVLLSTGAGLLAWRALSVAAPVATFVPGDRCGALGTPLTQ